MKHTVSQSSVTFVDRTGGISDRIWAGNPFIAISIGLVYTDIDAACSIISRAVWIRSRTLTSLSPRTAGWADPPSDPSDMLLPHISMTLWGFDESRHIVPSGRIVMCDWTFWMTQPVPSEKYIVAVPAPVSLLHKISTFVPDSMSAFISRLSLRNQYSCRGFPVMLINQTSSFTAGSEYALQFPHGHGITGGRFSISSAENMPGASTLTFPEPITSITLAGRKIPCSNFIARLISCI